MANIRKQSATVLATAILAAALTTLATAKEAPAESIRISSYKGNTLEVRERSGLIIGPSNTDYSVISSDPDTVAVEQMLTFWVAVTKAEGSAEITTSNSAVECGSMTLAVNSTTPTIPETPSDGDSTSLADNMEMHQEMIRLINQTRKANGASELPVNEALMNAAQRAVGNWINSPGHFQTIIDPRCDCIGVGAIQYDGITYCYTFVGIPNSVNFYM